MYRPTSAGPCPRPAAGCRRSPGRSGSWHLQQQPCHVSDKKVVAVTASAQRHMADWRRQCSAHLQQRCQQRPGRSPWSQPCRAAARIAQCQKTRDMRGGVVDHQRSVYQRSRVELANAAQRRGVWRQYRKMRSQAHLGLARRVPGGTLGLLLVRAEQLACLLLHGAGGRLDVAGRYRKEAKGGEYTRTVPEMNMTASQPQISIGKVLQACCRSENKTARAGFVHHQHDRRQQKDTQAPAALSHGRN